MNIKIDDKAVKFIKKQNFDDVHVFVQGCSSWGASEPQPLVLMGKPKQDIENFKVYEVDGINVYVGNDVQTGSDGIEIKYSKFLFKENIIVDGIVY